MSQDKIIGSDTGKVAFLTKVNGDIAELFAYYTAITAGSGVLVSSTDFSIGYLNGKLVAGNAITLTIGNAGGDETLTLDCGLPAITASDAKKTVQVNAAGDGFELGTPLKNILIAEDQKALGTDGGSSLAGENTRDINTVVYNGITGASLATNQITVPTGMFLIRADAPCYSGNMHQAYLYNVTDGAELKRGTSEYNYYASLVQNRSCIETVVTFSATTVLELRHYITNAKSTNGLGYSLGQGTEVYSKIFIEQLA